jgi:hypothetical protein
MPLVRVYHLRASTSALSRTPISIGTNTNLGRILCLRGYSQSSSPIPPPLPTDSTSKSSGLNHQLHPTGRSPLSPTARNTSANADAESTPSAENAGYRTPLRTVATNIPITARESSKVIYEGPLRKTVCRLKAFSISSLLLSTGMTPFILTVEANLPLVARVSMITAGSPTTHNINE